MRKKRKNSVSEAGSISQCQLCLQEVFEKISKEKETGSEEKTEILIK